MMNSNSTDSPTAGLGLADTVSVIVGIVVGVTIFKAPPLVFSLVAGPSVALNAWLLGGLLSLIGALCYAELATTYPRSGGDYVYLTRAFGPAMGFLFGWAQLVAILTGSIGALAYVFGDYAVELFQLEAGQAVWFAVAVVIGLSAINLAGMTVGKTTQNILTVAKIAGLVGIVVAALMCGQGRGALGARVPSAQGGFALAMVLVLYAYGGWNDAAFVSSEVRRGRRNIPAALFLGIGTVTVLYLLVNIAYVWALGFEGIRTSRAPAADVLQLALGDWGSKGMSLLVMISALGAVNGMIFTGARIYAALGADHRAFAWLGRWQAQRGTPARSLAVQAFAALVLILVVGTAAGRAGLDRCLLAVGLKAMPWENYGGGFDTLVAATAPIFWFFFLMTGISLIVLRAKDPAIERPFSVPLYPAVPLIFCGMCVYMLRASIQWAGTLALIGLLPVALGWPLYMLTRRGADRPVTEDPPPQ